MQREFQSNAVPVCAHCGSRNADGLRFCQDCGQKLVSSAVAAGGAGAVAARDDKRSGIPDTSARSSTPALGPVVSCPRCRVDNRPGMNFCKMCGALLPRPAEGAVTRERTALAAAVVEPAAPPPAIPAPTPPAPIRPPAGGAVVQAFPMGPICPRCRGANTPGAEFCRFCGTPVTVAAAPAPVPRSDSPPGTSLPARESYDTDRDTLVVQREAPSSGGRAGMETMPSSPSPIVPIVPVVPVAFAVAHDVRAVADPEPSPVVVREDPPVRLAVATQALGATSSFPLAQLTTVLRDGTTGPTYPLSAEQTDIGREEGNVLLPDDPYICPRHARIVHREGRFFLRDLHSVNGIFLRVTAAAPLEDHDAFLVGQQLLVLDLLDDGEGGLGPAVQHGTLLFGAPEVQCLARLTLWTTEGAPRDVHYLQRPETILGREVGDIVFPEDAFMSRRHAAVSCDLATRHFSLRDLDSSNGTYLRFRGEREVRFGDRFRLGQHLFRFDPVGAS